jgi:type IV fimbrial biogenesis protein FimT
VHRHRRGFSLAELLATMAIVAIALASAVPSFSELGARNRLRNVVERLRSDIQLARAESLRRDRDVILSFRRGDDGTAWCYGLSLAPGCDCRLAAGPGACELDPGVSTAVSSTDSLGIRLTAPAFGIGDGSLVLSAVRPTLTAGSARFASARNEAEVRVAAMGRVRLCSPAGETRLAYLDRC